jgi:quercetin dioxygenase-like cupin family protein
MSKHPVQQATQPEDIRRIMLQKFDVPGTNYVAVFGIAEIAPNADFASHTHPGTESGYLMEGSLTHVVLGRPVREAKAGDSVLIPAGVPHSGRAGPNGAKIISIWVVEKGKPLASLLSNSAANSVHRNWPTCQVQLGECAMQASRTCQALATVGQILAPVGRPYC